MNAYAAYAVGIVAGMASAVYLVISGHEWFGLLAFLIVGCMDVTTPKGKE